MYTLYHSLIQMPFRLGRDLPEITRGMTYPEDTDPDFIARFNSLPEALEALRMHQADAWIEGNLTGKILMVKEWYVVETTYDEEEDEYEDGDYVACCEWPEVVDLRYDGYAYDNAYYTRDENGEMVRNKRPLEDWEMDEDE